MIAMTTSSSINVNPKARVRGRRSVVISFKKARDQVQRENSVRERNPQRLFKCFFRFLDAIGSDGVADRKPVNLPALAGTAHRGGEARGLSVKNRRPRDQEVAWKFLANPFGLMSLCSGRPREAAARPSEGWLLLAFKSAWAGALPLLAPGLGRCRVAPRPGPILSSTAIPAVFDGRFGDARDARNSDGSSRAGGVTPVPRRPVSVRDDAPSVVPAGSEKRWRSVRGGGKKT